jgi:hypothetical protein
MRVVHQLGERGALGRYTEVGERPGFVRALADTLLELRLAELGPEQLAPHDPDLARLLRGYEEALRETKLCDRAGMLEAARRAVEEGQHKLCGIPLLALDLPLAHAAEAAFARALCAGRQRVCVTVARGDDRSETFWRFALASKARVERLSPSERTDLDRLKLRLFTKQHERPETTIEKGRVKLLSSPGESREAVEVARELVQCARQGIPFDRMAVCLRASDAYRDVVEEALARAQIPAYFADGVRRPAPQGRALLALLACAREGLSARGFAEYLSLGMAPALVPGDAQDAQAEPPEGARVPSPRRWEKLIVDAAVVGGHARWRQRLSALLRSLEKELDRPDLEEPARAALEVRRDQLEALMEFALPRLALLQELPEGGTWGQWLAALERLARSALREPDSVCETLLELAPLSPIGPVRLTDVERLLSRRLGSVLVRSTGSAAGKVFVGAIDDVLGRAFDVVYVLGLAEKVFPPRVLEDPLLADAQRRLLGPNLMLTEERVARERLLLRLSVGAARRAVVLSFPRFDSEHGRPRVPSFYGLEVLHAVEGELPAFDELTRRAEPGAAARMGFPAPADAALAIDHAEYDLSVLDQWRAQASDRTGGARYVLLSNAHLARALRFRARRWESTRFNTADGLVLAPEAAARLLASQLLTARAYSATALAQFASCPYRFFLYAIMGLSEREEVAELDELDARQRGVLFHTVQRLVLQQLSDRGLLPLEPARLPEAEALLTEIFAQEVARAREEHAPVIQRVFELALSNLRTDLREWLRRIAEERSWVPAHFELGFGLAASDQRDRRSSVEPVALDVGILLRGAIDLVEQSVHKAPDGRLMLRATDHKTGQNELRQGAILAGGRVLQPVLSALALERLFPEARVDSGRLYFCTTRADFQSHEVPLHAAARNMARELAQAIQTMLSQGFLPAAPGRFRGEGAECERCSYRVVCGPYEPERVARVKAPDAQRLAPLHHLRNLP